METRPYRADIDGLRAIAVLSLILFHYGVAGISGGFLGVDILFVVSGYLVARSIFQDVRTGTWSYSGFYVRRLRRLFPALFATLAASYAAALFLLMPDDLQWFATAALHSAVATSNFLYWFKAGYFGASAADTPLLNTWAISAAVQLYLVWPVLMLAVLGQSATRLRVGLLIAIMALAAGLSVWAGQVVLQTDARAAFYLMPFRIAELAAGALLVWVPRLPARLRRWEDWLLLAGIGLLLLCIVGYDRKTPFPGLGLLLPTLGAALVVYAGQAPRLGYLLRNPALVWVGLIAYPLYLVHWPLLGFVQVYLLRPIAGWEKPALILVALGLGWLLARLVERPFRDRSDRTRQMRPPAFALACAGLTIALLWTSALVLLGEGWVWRIPSEVRAPLAGLEFARHGRETANRVGVCHLNMWVGKTALGGYVDDRCMHVDPERPNYLIIGDSHGGDRYAGLSALFPEVNFLQMTTASCRPLLDTDFTDYYCPERMEYVYRAYLPRTRLDGVILAGRWQEKDLDRLRATLKHLRGLKHRVIVLGPAVEIFPWVPDLVFHHGRLAGLEAWVSRFIAPERLEMDRRIRDLSVQEGAEYYSAIDALCPNLRCPVLGPSGGLLIVDYGHQSPEGALAQAQGFQRLGLALPRREPVHTCSPAAAQPPGTGG